MRTIVVESTACPVMLVGGDAGAENEMKCIWSRYTLCSESITAFAKGFYTCSYRFRQTCFRKLNGNVFTERSSSNCFCCNPASVCVEWVEMFQSHLCCI